MITCYALYGAQRTASAQASAHDSLRVAAKTNPLKPLKPLSRLGMGAPGDPRR